MSNDYDQEQFLEEDPFDALRDRDFMKIFDELSFKEKWQRVLNGLKQDESSGEHKWAKLQLIRLLSPLMAVLIPVLMMFLIAFLAQFDAASQHSFQVKVIEPVPLEELEEIEIPKPERLEVTDPVEMQVDVSSDMPSLPSDVVSPPAETASVQPAEFDSVAQIRSPVVMTGIMGSRNPGSRGAALGRFGGGAHTEQAVLRALRWLAKTQGSDGSWGNNKVAMTSLAVLAYLAHGDTPASEEFGQTVERAIRFIISQQEDNGRFKGRDKHDYTQPIAAYALAEAYGMTKTPAIRDAAVKAMRIIVQGQNPSGSFDYNLKRGGTGRDDLSYAAWCVQALKAATIAGLDKDLPGIKDTMQLAIPGVRGHFRQQSTSAGVFGYGKGADKYHGLTGAGVLSMQFLGQGGARETKLGLAGMDRWAFNWQEPPPGSIVYYWYYITQAYFQEGGETWTKWNNLFSRPLAAAQTVISKAESGYVDHKGVAHETGYWDSPAARESTGGNGRVMDTLLCTLMLEVYYRYLPTFQQIPQEEIQRELGGDEDDLVIRIVQTRPEIRETVNANMYAYVH
jgi:prenyltransferase beta subunit